MARAAAKGVLRIQTGALSARARRRQARIVALWFLAIGVTFIATLALAGAANAQSAVSGNPPDSPTPVPELKALQPIPKPIRVARDVLPCAISAGDETGMLLVTISNSSKQVIGKHQIVYYELGRVAGEPLHGVRSPIVVPLGGQFSQLVPVQADLQAGGCKAWIYEPLESLQFAE